jgi:SAM-dependent methyltransferase
MTSAPPRMDIASVLRLTELADYIVPFTLRVICELRVADHLTEWPRPVDELAAATGAHPPALLRCLRALASRGIFTETEPAVFALNALAQPLRGDHPMSLRDAYPLLAPDIAAWARFDHSLRTGEAAFDLVHGTGYWEYMAAYPDDSARYNGAQRAAAQLELRTAVSAVPWGSFGTIVDVGGADGVFLAGILARFTSVRGIVFDLPHVVAAAERVLAERGVADRCTAIAGDFFDSVPAGADAYVLKRILAGWDDERAGRLLRTVRAAMRPGGRLLILEPVLQPGNEFEVGKLQDVQLVTMVGGGGRTLNRMSAMLAEAGLRFVRLIPTMMSQVLEAEAV